FHKQAEESVNAIHVSQRVDSGVGGALHEETVYGVKKKGGDGGDRPWAKNWVEEEGVYVYRKPVTSLTSSMLEDIRDPVIKKVIAEHLKPFGIAPGDGKQIP